MSVWRKREEVVWGQLVNSLLCSNQQAEPPRMGKKSRIKTVSVLKMWPPRHHFFCLVGTRKEFTDLSSARHYPNHPPPSIPPTPFFLSHTHLHIYIPVLPPAILRIPSCNFSWPLPQTRHTITQWIPQQPPPGVRGLSWCLRNLWLAFR